MLDNNQSLLHVVKSVNTELALVQENIDKLNVECTSLEHGLNTAYNDTSHVLNRTSDLKLKSQSNVHKQEIAQAFLARFTLSPQESQHLLNSDGTISIGFFNALDRLQQIMSDCTVLLVSDSQKAG